MLDLKRAWVAVMLILLPSLGWADAASRTSRTDDVSEVEKQLLGSGWAWKTGVGSTGEHVTSVVFEDGAKLMVVHEYRYYDGDRKIWSTTSGSYRITPTGAVVFEWTSKDRREVHQRTFAVVDGALSRLVHPTIRTYFVKLGHRVWTNGGLRAQDDEGRRFRGEWSIETARPDRELERRGFVTDLVFEKPPVSGESCSFRLDISVEVLQGAVESSTRKSFEMTCRIDPVPNLSLHHIRVDGFIHDTRGITERWSDFLDGLEINKTHGYPVYETFRDAFLPVLYFDPSNPRLLVHPSNYQPLWWEEVGPERVHP